jgi:multiple sugar transport system substrate-binding protein
VDETLMIRRARKTLAAAAALASVAALTTACGGSSSSGGVVDLTYMIWQPSEQAAYQQSIDVFEKAHPDIHVTIEVVPWAQYWAKLQTSAAGRTMPDVFWDHLAYLPELAKDGIITNIADDARSAKIDLSQYSPKLLAQWENNGVLYGLPKDWDTIETIYDAKDLAAAGITPAQLGSLSWNTTDGGSFVQALEKLTLDRNGKHPDQAGFDAGHIKQYGIALEAPNGQQDWWDFGVQNGCRLQSKPYGTWTVNSTACVQAIQFEQDLMYKWHVAAPGTITNTPNAASLPQILAQNTAAITFDGDWDLDTYQSSMPAGSWGVAALPTGPAGSGTVFNGLTDAIYAGTKHPQQAWELEEWLGSADSEKIVTDTGTVWAAIPSLDQGFITAWKAKGIDVSAFYQGSQGTTIGYPLTTQGTAFTTVVLKDMNQVWLDQMTPQAAANDITSVSNAAVASGN